MPDFAQYRLKIIDVLASQLSEDCAEALAIWCGGTVIWTFIEGGETSVPAGVDIPTLDGVKRANIGDFIVKGAVGEFYPVRSDIFLAKYTFYEAIPTGSDF